VLINWRVIKTHSGARGRPFDQFLQRIRNIKIWISHAYVTENMNPQVAKMKMSR